MRQEAQRDRSRMESTAGQIRERNEIQMDKEKGSQDLLRWKWLSGNIVRRDRWVDLRENTYLLPNGQEITPYYTTRNRSFSVIVARDQEGSYICVRQFRPGTETVTTEFPAGGMEDGEDPLDAAKRELLEETGYEAERWTSLGRIAPNATIANNYAYIFLAEGCRKVSGRHLDETECMETAVLSSAVMDEMIAECRVIQAVHVAAYYMAREKHRVANA